MHNLVSENTLKIKVTIANRAYPLTIKREEEGQIRTAVKTINDAVTRFESATRCRISRMYSVCVHYNWLQKLNWLRNNLMTFSLR